MYAYDFWSIQSLHLRCIPNLTRKIFCKQDRLIQMYERVSAAHLTKNQTPIVDKTRHITTITLLYIGLVQRRTANDALLICSMSKSICLRQIKYISTLCRNGTGADILPTFTNSLSNMACTFAMQIFVEYLDYISGFYIELALHVHYIDALVIRRLFISPAR